MNRIPFRLGSTDKTGQRTPPGQRLPGSSGPADSDFRPSGGAGASLLWNRNLAVPFLVFLAALAVGLMFLMPGGFAQAQATSTTIEYAENGTGPVATFTATDPEGVTPIAWTRLTNADGMQDIDGDGTDDVVTDDVADHAHFSIDKDGVLKFNIADPDTTDDNKVGPSPDFENSQDAGTDNIYKVVVVACDVPLDDSGNCTGDNVKPGYHKVTVKVTNVSEQGKVTLATNTSNGTPQFMVSAILTATASDGDKTGADKKFTSISESGVSGVAWRWYRGESLIPTDQYVSNNAHHQYQLQAADEGQRIRAVAYYIIGDNTDQEMAEKTTDYPVLPSRAATKLKFNPSTVSISISEGGKGRNVGSPVTATDNYGTIRYKLAESGDDNAKFKIDEKTGQITTNVVLNYEGNSSATATAEGACETANGGRTKCRVTVIATDSTGRSTSGTTGDNPSATVDITLTDVDEAPTFDDNTSPKTASVLETATAVSTSTATAYAATDPEGLTVAYGLSGPDESKFQLKAGTGGITGQVLEFKAKPDFEAKASADGDNVYEVTVTAAAGDGETGKQIVKVTVDGVNEGPDVSGLSTKNFTEEGTGPVATFSATDPEGATSIEWLIPSQPSTLPEGFVEGDFQDQLDFDIDKKTGALTFDVGGDDDPDTTREAADYENPSGEGGTTSNTYKVVVGACDLALADDGTCPDGGEVGYHKVVVTVTEVSEQGKVKLVTNTSNGTPQYLVGAQLTATASDGDIKNSNQEFQGTDRANVVTGIAWQWYRGGNAIDGATNNTYTLAEADKTYRIRAKVTYQVGTNINRETVEKTTDYPVLADRVGDSELKFDPSTVSISISEGDKGRNVGAPVTATGNYGTVRYTLGGTDVAMFDIDDKTGQITTKEDLSYEVLEGENNDCGDNRQCSVTVSARDSKGDTNPSATVNITLTDVDEAPTFNNNTSPKTASVAEDAKAVSTNTATAYAATDPEGLTVTYGLSGPDESKFQLKAGTGGITGQVLEFKAKPDFEAKASADGDNVYEVTVTATAGGKTGRQMVKVTVTGVDEAPTNISSGLSISGDSNVRYAENGTTEIDTYTATGVKDDATVSWSVTGDDAGDFSISSGGVLSFASPPDYEAPADANTDNVYKVTVNATDGTNSDTHDVTVTVTNVEEAGTVTLSTTEPSVGTAVTAMLTDPDGGVTGEGWKWQTSATEDGDYTDIADATSASYEPVAADSGNYIRAMVRYTDGHGSGKSATSTAHMVGDLSITGDASASVAENSTAVATYTAAGPNAANVTWTKEGADADYFDISGGVLTFITAPNYEMPRGQAMSDDNTNTYMVTVKATDNGNSDIQAVEVTVTNVEEAGTVTLGSAPRVGAEVKATLTDPDGMVTMTGEGEGWQWQTSDTVGGEYADIADATSDTYTPVADDKDKFLRATVTYTDGEGSGKSGMSPSVEVADQNALLDKFDTNDNGKIDRLEVLTAIQKYLDPADTSVTRLEVITLIGRYFDDRDSE